MKDDKRSTIKIIEDALANYITRPFVGAGAAASPCAHYSVEPSNEKDYDILLMTGNSNEEGSDKQ